MKVSISYAHTSDAHEKKVLSLVEKLAENGIDFTIDYYDLEIGDDLYYFMEKLTLSDENNYVLVICNEKYKEKSDNYKGGVGFEARNLRYISYKPANSKVIPIIFEYTSSGEAIRPNFLLTSTYIDLANDENFNSKEFQELINFLKGVKRLKPKINQSPEFQNFNDVGNDQLPYFHNIDFNRKINLTERSKKIVADIAQHFEETKFKDASVLKPLLLRSWSGEGKTTIAIEFAYKFGLQFNSCLWIDSSKNIGDQFVEFSSKLNISIPHEISVSNDLNAIRKFKLDSVKNYINQHSVLLIFDNIDKINDVTNFLPKTGKARVILITTNFNIKTEGHFQELTLPKLTTEEALQILTYGCNFSESDKVIATRITELLGNLSFALELANSYLLEYHDIKLSSFYEDLLESSVRWDGLKKEAGFNFIHSTPSVISLIEKKVGRLDESLKLDKSCIDALSIIGCLEIAKDEFDFKTIKELLGLSEETKENLMAFSRIKNKISELGLSVLADDKFILHTLTLEYLKLYVTNEYWISILIQYKLHNIRELINFQIRLGLWMSGQILHSTRILLLHLYKTFPPHNSNKINQFISYALIFCEGLYFYSKDNDCLEILDLALELSNKDKNFKFSNTRQNDIQFHRSISLHRLELYDEALKIYDDITQDEAGVSHAISMINCYIYKGHIHRLRKNKDFAIKSYDLALKGCKQFYDDGFLSESESLIHKIRTLMYYSCLYNEFGMMDKFTENQINTDKAIDSLMNFAPEEAKEKVKSLEKDNPQKYPFEIGQQIIMPCGYKPLETALQFREIRKME